MKSREEHIAQARYEYSVLMGTHEIRALNPYHNVRRLLESLDALDVDIHSSMRAKRTSKCLQR